jgi:hypothetical protein
MANYKNRKPKPYKGCCGMCALRYSNGRRCGRKLTMAERRARLDEREQRLSADAQKSSSWSCS